MTSPPYFSLRTYGDAENEIGAEGELDAYIGNLVDVFRECRRVLHPSGVLWLNLGDTWRRKQLLGVPWRVAFALQDDGWTLRSENIWHKPNGLPKFAGDRPVPCHETVFMFSKRQRYFYDAEAVREPSESGPSVGGGVTRTRRSVWKIATEDYKGDHFAVMPSKLAEVCVLAGSSEQGCCPACGAPHTRIVELGEPLDSAYLRYCGADKTGGTKSKATKDFAGTKAQDASEAKRRILAGSRERKTVDWVPTCKCDAGEPVSAVVLDPFCGVGTTGLVALQHGRSFVGIELYEANLEQARERLAAVKKVEDDEGETLVEAAA